jgi:thiol-disulfide isomerase/thioredoxin
MRANPDMSTRRPCFRWSPLASLPVFLAALLGMSAAAAEVRVEVPDLEGRVHAPLATRRERPLVLVFVSPFCPTSTAFVPELARLGARYGDRVEFRLVAADAGVTAAIVRRQAEEYGLGSGVLLDAERKLARAAGATVTPEAVVFGRDGAVLYRGRVNDLYLSRTKKQAEPKVHDLADALEAILAGRPVASPQPKAIGCSIPAAE